MRGWSLWALSLCVVASALGCGGDPAPPPGLGGGDGALPAFDLGREPADLGRRLDQGEPAPDAGPGQLDLSVPADSGAPDLGPADQGPRDLGPEDSGPSDQGAPDLGPGDLGSGDLGPGDGGAADGGVGDGGGGLDQGPGPGLDLGPADAGPSPVDDGGPAEGADQGPAPPADLGPPPPVLRPLITEFMATNDGLLLDEDGEASDWIELHNPHGVALSLAGYRLSDDLAQPARCVLPARDLAPGGYLVVFASGKTRLGPEGPLHCGFRLDAGGETLALFSPEGQPLQVFEGWPQQSPELSWGFAMQQEAWALVGSDSPLRYRVVDAASPADDWSAADYVEGPEWRAGVPGLGYDEAELPHPAFVATESQRDFSGQQGGGGWFYGTWDAAHDADGVYDPAAEFRPFPRAPGPYGPDNAWTGEEWRAFPLGGGGPWLGALAGQPGAGGTWVVRRWVAAASGRVELRGQLSHLEASGDGVLLQLWVGGRLVLEQDAARRSRGFTLDLSLERGTAVDLVLGPGLAGDAQGDLALVSLTVEYRGEEPAELGPMLADSVADWSVDGLQGQRGWTAGYWDRSADPDGAYAPGDFVPFPRGGGGFGPADFWTGQAWDWYAGNPPWTMIGQEAVHSNGVNNRVEHWAIRRWMSPVAGTLVLQWSLAKTNPNGSGVTGHLIHEGQELDAAALAGADTVGVVRRVVVPDVAASDRIDLAHDPHGPNGDPSDGSDGSTTRLQVWLAPDLRPFLRQDPGPALRHAAGLQLRIPFMLPADLEGSEHLSLSLRYDDGYALLLDGDLLAADNVELPLGPGSRALHDRATTEAAVAEGIPLDGALGRLRAGSNVLALQVVQAASPDERFLAEFGLRLQRVRRDEEPGYLARPTPGAPNFQEGASQGPLVQSLTRDPPAVAGEPLPIEATVIPTVDALDAVTLTYRVGYEPEQVLPMERGEGNRYHATLPGEVVRAGQMLRWFAVARDVAGRGTRAPRYDAPLDSEQYYGTVPPDPAVVSALPVLHYFVQAPDQANTAGGTRASLWFAGEFYDNVRVDLHGQSTRAFPKKSYNIDLPRDHRFALRAGEPRMKDFNLLSNWADKSKMRNTLAYAIYRDAGADYHLAFPIRVQRNGAFFAVYDFVEDGDDRWLERLGYPSEGALYKVYDSLNDPNRGEKKTRREEDHSDLAALIAGLRLAGEERRRFLYDNVDFAAMNNYLAAMFVTSNRDCCHKNYYAYRDTEGDQEWWYMPWDQDLSFGRNWTGNYYDDTMYPDNPLYVGQNNLLIGALFQLPEFQEMYLRRCRSLSDLLLQPPGTPPEELRFEAQVAELEQALGADADADHDAWPFWGQDQSFAEAVEILRRDYLAPRRDFVYGQLVGSDEDDPRQVLVSGDPGEAALVWQVAGDDALGDTWTAPEFDDGAWTPGTFGVGYEASPADYAGLLSSQVRPSDVVAGATSVRVRVPFVVEAPEALESLALRVKYDDGFVAWINGVEVARRNLPAGLPAWNAQATDHNDGAAVVYETVAIPAALPLLWPGDNLLAVQVVNSSVGSSDLLLTLELCDRAPAGVGPLPRAQAAEVQVALAELEPSWDEPSEAYLRLDNPEDVALDLSDWLVVGSGLRHRLQPGTVLPVGGSVYVVADPRRFRGRALFPTGGQGLFVQGPWQGALRPGEPVVEVFDPRGRPAAR